MRKIKLCECTWTRHSARQMNAIIMYPVQDPRTDYEHRHPKHHWACPPNLQWQKPSDISFVDKKIPLYQMTMYMDGKW